MTTIKNLNIDIREGEQCHEHEHCHKDECHTHTHCHPPEDFHPHEHGPEDIATHEAVGCAGVCYVPDTEEQA